MAVRTPDYIGGAWGRVRTREEWRGFRGPAARMTTWTTSRIVEGMFGFLGTRSLCVALGLAFALHASTARAEGGAADEDARKHFKVGISYLQDPEGERFEEAYGEFKLAYELSQSPKVLGNMGLCAMKLERDGEAINSYTRYLREVPDIEPDERAQIERDLPALEASAVHLSIKVGPSNASLTDTRYPAQGANVRNVYTPTPGSSEIVVRSGHHVMTLSVDAQTVASWEFTAEPGSKLSHDFSVGNALAKPSTPAGASSSSSRSRTVPLIVTGVGVAAVAAGGVFGLVTLGKVSDLEKKCPNDTCPASSYASDVDPVRTYVRTTDVLLLGGAAVTAVGVTWLLLSGPSAQSQMGSATSPRVFGLCSNKACAGSLRVAF